MAINLVVAVTDYDWFQALRVREDWPEVNFWAPSGANFRALQPGELFLFKLHAPRNYIVGGGVFAHSITLPCSLAWETFGQANGAADLAQMRARIMRYRQVGTALDAAHIRPYAEGGELVANGLLLRRDIHCLFDLGYVTVTPEHVFEVSRAFARSSKTDVTTTPCKVVNSSFRTETSYGPTLPRSIGTTIIASWDRVCADSSPNRT